ncbi:hypothetical protein [Sphingomonas sp.]|uniref:hypothetical protein n=1 Tax=Sphingomonas sp. TaxID=28214 RepID=UPI00286DA495|nr:hypothetical protein [Sphingomonas sp.]
MRTLAKPATLRDGAAKDAAAIIDLPAGTAFAMLDSSRGWAWGYAGKDRRVGYVPSYAVSAG